MDVLAREISCSPAGRTIVCTGDRVSQVAVLVDAVQRVVAGECVVVPSIVSRLVNRTGLTEPLSVLTPASVRSSG